VQHRNHILLMSLVLASVGGGCSTHDQVALQPAPPAPTVTEAQPIRPSIDRSGRARVGVASFYADRFAGRTMADGVRMDPQGENAASRTLPLGTTAKVTNLVTGKSAVVTIEDRGPYAKGRIVDLSPSTARRIGITQRLGVARVVVAPIAVPLADGSLKPGVAAQEDLSPISQD
jgi:rare lipoprotein A